MIGNHAASFLPGVVCILLTSMPCYAVSPDDHTASGKMFLRSTDPLTPSVLCTEHGVRATFHQGLRSRIKVVDLAGMTIKVPTTSNHCKTVVSSEASGLVTFSSAYDGCYVHAEEDSYIVILEVRLLTGGPPMRIHISCPRPLKESTDMEHDCLIPSSLRVACGTRGASVTACLSLGCCYSRQTGECYYKMDECSRDGHFVFAIQQEATRPALQLKSLKVQGHGSCMPVIITEEVAVFKFSVAECGVQKMVTGHEVKYVAMIVAEPEISDVGYGPISRDSGLRLQVECSYSRKHVTNLELSAMAFPSPQTVAEFANIAVEMRISKDATFQEFFETNDLPIHQHLQEPIFVEVRLVEPLDPSLSLVVRDCFAYPRTQESLWILLFNGCPNLLDEDHHSTILDGDLTGLPSHYRRFDVKTFAFVDQETGEPLEDEMYFYCWVEICYAGSPDCVPKCLQTPYPKAAESERFRRDIDLDLRTALVSLGPVILVNNETSMPNPKTWSSKTFDLVPTLLSYYSLSAICSVSILFLILSVAAGGIWHCKRRKAIVSHPLFPQQQTDSSDAYPSNELLNLPDK
uniref:Zona pellucida sperm-binding protein 4-like n=1 Tax=Erpetoichthys calabaricus TaxID=27687 RepID=A0A8C4TFL9_ERPCA